MPAFPIVSFQPLQLTATIPNVGTGVLVFNTSLPISTDDPNPFIWINWWGAIITPTGTTSYTLKCFRGTQTSGTLLDQWAGNSVWGASKQNAFQFSWHDVPGGALAQQIYTFTIVFNGATDNTGGVANGGCIILAL